MDADFDIVVIGGGHAGVEAARAAALLGAKAGLITLLPETIAQMSCNPAIGGVGKGQIVREIDALGGLMGLAADATGIQFRMLNRSKGPAVWGPRCQSDRHAYARWVQDTLSRVENLTIIAGEATEIVTEHNRVVGVRITSAESKIKNQKSKIGSSAPSQSRLAALESEIRNPKSEMISCRAVIVTAGTFLSGLLHFGDKTWPGGRMGEPSADRLSHSLRACGLELARLKTGTCPRLAAGTIDYARCTRQDGDDPPAPFSFLNDSLDIEQTPCWLTHTTGEVHDAIRANLHRAPMYSGQISSTGPRYCPSIETKIVRFPDKREHLIFLEPEGRPGSTDWVYANGIATSLPRDVQEFMVRHIPGLERAEVLQWGYAIEYDYVPPTQLRASLESRSTAGLYLAGQVNGTTGYEEAAGQGLIAGINAARALRSEPPVVLRRDQAYIGVMIDDLVTKGVAEPYRMFTSRAEHRLRLRADNADRRLTELGREIGLVDDARWRRYAAAGDAAGRAETLLRSIHADGKSLWDALQQPGTTLEGLLDGATGEPAGELSLLLRAQPAALRSVAIDARYAGYLLKQEADVRRMRQLDDRLIPERIDYGAISHLRHEAREQLARLRPRSLGQALRISGITPADVTVLAVHLARM